MAVDLSYFSATVPKPRAPLSPEPALSYFSEPDPFDLRTGQRIPSISTERGGKAATSLSTLRAPTPPVPVMRAEASPLRAFGKIEETPYVRERKRALGELETALFALPIFPMGKGAALGKVVTEAELLGPLRQGLRTLREKIPAEQYLWRTVPPTPVITNVEQHAVNLEAQLSGLLEKQWVPTMRQYQPEDFVAWEKKAVDLWKTGGETPEAYAQAVQAMPADIQQMLHYRQQRLLLEQQAREELGLPEIPERSGPYFPRLTDQDMRDVVQMAKGRSTLGHDLSQTIKTFQKSRVYDTMAEGIANGTVYDDPRKAWLLREWFGIKLIETANLMRTLKGRVLFETPAEAKAASKTGEAFVIEGLPGKVARYWVPSRDERLFLQQNLNNPEGGFSGMVHLSNQLFRNPNLFNPLPHFVKNMAYKYALSGGSMRKMAPDMVEFLRFSNPELVTRFNDVMPFSKTGQTVHSVLAEQLQTGPLSQAIRAVGAINKPSSKVIFSYLDPALKYARWKQYVGKGMTDQAAANQVHVDLIRYGTRSELVDFWKSVPMNFFVPWRVGTVGSLAKQIGTRPLQAAAFIGAVDYLREAHYRQTGRWTHLPIDYIEGPIATLLAKHDAKTTAAMSGTTALLGPGGHWASMKNMIDTLQGKGDWDVTKRMFWGLSQMFNLPNEWEAYQKTGDTQHLANLLMSIAVSEHDATKYGPRRFMRGLPESFPFLQTSPRVRWAEEVERGRELKIERLQKRRDIRKDLQR